MSPDGSEKPVKPWLYNFDGFLGRLKEATEKPYKMTGRVADLERTAGNLPAAGR